MAELQQLERSFLQAHKAGDTKAAGVLAAEIKRQRASGSSAPAADAPVSGMFDQFVSGLDQPLEDIGVTMEMTGMKDAGKAVRDFTSKPENFVSAGSRVANPAPGDSYVDPLFGIGWGNVPGALAEQAGGYAGLMALRWAGGAAGGALTKNPYGAAAGALAGPALFSFARQLGPSVLKIAENDGRGPDELTWADWSQAAATAGVSGALDAFGIGKIGILNNTVKEVGKKTATEVVKGAVKETGKKAIQEGVTEAGQSVVEQFGTSAGTKTGAKVDLKEAFAEGIIGGAAGGTIDATRNVRPVFNTAMDVRSVDSQMRNNPDAQTKAELTRDVNDIAGRMGGSGKEPLSQELNRYTSDLKRQIKEAIDGQELDPEDKKALKGGMQDATGLTQDRLDEIAGRSENPSEIKALARKIQVIRETTMQRQTAKGFRGAAAWTAENMGPYAGGAIGATIGGEPAAVIGAAQGAALGKSIARKLRGNQTQGNAIDQLVGAKQARRAAILLDRYGPSEATTALNTLSEKAAANKAQAEADAQAQKDWQDTINRIKMSNAIRKNAREQWENAPPELKAQKKAEKETVDLKTREERLKGLAIRSEQSRVRLETMVNRLESEKSTNALRVEKAQAERDLANAKAQGAAKGQILDLSGKLLKLVDDIKLREQAIKKSVAVTKRAEKMAERVPQAKQASKAAATQTARRYAKMTADQLNQVQVDQFGEPIDNRAQYMIKAHEIMRIQRDGLVDAVKFDDKAIGNMFIEAIGDFKNAPGHKNQAKRMAIYERILRDVPRDNLDAQRFIALYIRPLAFAFEAASGDPDSFGSSSRRPEGREDFGTDEDTGEDPPF